MHVVVETAEIMVNIPHDEYPLRLTVGFNSFSIKLCEIKFRRKVKHQ